MTGVELRIVPPLYSWEKVVFKIKELTIGIKSIQDFINHAAKRLPDKDVRGFTDHVNYMQEVLNRVLNVFKYFDDTWYNSTRSYKDPYDELECDSYNNLTYEEDE